jgi:hypothetical protein
MRNQIDRIPWMPCLGGYRRPIRPARGSDPRIAVHVQDAGIAKAAFARSGGYYSRSSTLGLGVSPIRRQAEMRFCPRHSIAQFTARMPHPAGASKSRIYKIGLMAYLSLRHRFSCSLGPVKARTSHQRGGSFFLPRYRHGCLGLLRPHGEIDTPQPLVSLEFIDHGHHLCNSAAAMRVPPPSPIGG